MIFIFFLIFVAFVIQFFFFIIMHNSCFFYIKLSILSLSYVMILAYLQWKDGFVLIYFTALSTVHRLFCPSDLVGFPSSIVSWHFYLYYAEIAGCPQSIIIVLRLFFSSFSFSYIVLSVLLLFRVCFLFLILFFRFFLR